MIQSSNEKGLNHPFTIQASQKSDGLMNETKQTALRKELVQCSGYHHFK
ncbi:MULTISPECIES: aspartyl-phosphate phosphatase Spo0E family protein [Siminovitchia]